MSIFGAMFSGVTGLGAQSQALGMIADNISNVNTIGYKGSTAQFSTLVTQSASRTSYTPGGVQSAPSQSIDRQGLLQSSTSRTDIAIAGRGFFVVNESATPGIGNEYLFTRAGSFDPDENGNLVNTSGYFLQGWPLSNGATLPSNTSVLTSVRTVNVSNLAGTATQTTNVNLSLNLPSTATAAAGGGQINSPISPPLNGITDIDYNGLGTVGQTATVLYVAATRTMSIDIGGQVGTFDLTAGTPGIYVSSGTLSGMEITLAGSFDFLTDIAAQANTVGETGLTGAEPSTTPLATSLTGVSTISFNNAVATDDMVTLEYNNTTGILTVTDLTTAQSGTVTIGTSGGLGVQDFTIAAGPLAGTVITIDTNTFNFGTTFTNAGNVSVGTKTGGTSGVGLTSVATTIDAGDLRQLNLTAAQNFVFTITQNAAANDTIAIDSAPAGWTVTSPSVTGDLSTGNVTVTFNKGGESFTVLVTAAGAVADGDTYQVTLALNELRNKVAADADDLVVAATTPILSNFDADDLASLSTTAMVFNVDANGRVIMTSGPTGYSVDQSSTQSLAATGSRNVVVTNGTRSFTVTLDITTAITTGSADIAVDLLELQNTFGLAPPATNGSFSATVQIFDSLGNAHDLVLEFDKIATNSWQIIVSDPVLAATGVVSGTVTAASRSISFNGDGTPSVITFPPIVISNWTTGANNATVAFNLGTAGQSNGITQFAGEFSLSSIDQDGVRFGGFVGVNIGEDGIVTAVFDNGEQLPVYQLPLALFANPNGLEARSGNAYAQTDRSGDILLQQANTGGAGIIAASALEASTVDLAEEFTKMITTQRAYSASAKIITTADEMLEELIRIRR